MKGLLKCILCTTLITRDEAELGREIAEKDEPLCRPCATRMVNAEIDALDEIEDEDDDIIDGIDAIEDLVEAKDEEEPVQ